MLTDLFEQVGMVTGYSDDALKFAIELPAEDDDLLLSITVGDAYQAMSSRGTVANPDIFPASRRGAARRRRAATLAPPGAYRACPCVRLSLQSRGNRAAAAMMSADGCWIRPAVCRAMSRWTEPNGSKADGRLI